MRLIFGVCSLIGFLYATPVFAQQNFGAGLVIGDPTGLTAKYELNKNHAVDSALSFFNDEIYLHGTWLWMMPTLFDIDNYPFNWYFGLGARMITHDHGRHHRHGDDDDDADDHFHFGARAPVGLRMNFNNPKIEIFGEVSLALDVAPKLNMDLDFGIGARYYF
ncbi:MAG: hypothetical protein AB7G93_12300 [Bdellovibrionales bacterium]